eukprot:CAMPEP_0196589636 /NCGR_PEP_ID=MMETSP1081-20130531/64134_1 /TAXON_ID=36882 /ORGANISM="Pyramimonas amylifera, Strain CCMP720" /LENGTH=470 /DNA_ID=CAMNT_0041912489 /DNA_START=114 /DNA_END=1523 /DNA_ORIENTATION=+
MQVVVVFFLFALLCSRLQSAQADIEFSREYKYSIDLFEGYKIHWTIVGDDFINLALEVVSLEWVGFGIAEPATGSMGGADMITGYVDSSGGHITDRWAVAKGVTPAADACQDWTLLSWQEDSETSTTVLELTRLLQPADTRQDRPILDDGVPTKVVGAWGNSDTFGMHKGRFTGAVNFFVDPSTLQEPLDQIKARSDVVSWALLSSSYPIPMQRTTYYEKCFEVPEVVQDAHVIAIEHQVDPSSEPYVHHFVVHGYTEQSCSRTSHMVYGWAPGSGPFVFPEEAGLRIGWGTDSEGAKFKSFRVQTHFDNPTLVPNLIDNSGIIAYYTSTLRQHDAGILQLGNPTVFYGSILPSGISKYVFNCPSSCTEEHKGPITVFRSSGHMHATGRQFYTEHRRANESAVRRTNMEFYDFNFQDFNNREVYIINPGDHLQTTCIYETDGTVIFGLGSEQEMCIDFIMYYPLSNVGNW